MIAKFKVGEKVKIKKNPKRYHGDPSINGDMPDYFGQTVTVKEVITEDHEKPIYHFKEIPWSWGELWLEKPNGVAEVIEIIEIKEGLASFLKKKKGRKTVQERMVRLKDLTGEVVRRGRRAQISQTPILPPGTRYHEKREGADVIVLEIPPLVREVLWTSRGRNDIEKIIDQKMRKEITFSLAFPYVIVVFGFRREKVQTGGWGNGLPMCFFSNSPVSSFSDRLCHTHLQNVANRSHWLCLHPDDLPAGIARGCEAILNDLWNGIFTNNMQQEDDYHHGLAEGIDARVRRVTDWQKNTLEDPLFILDIAWRESAYSVGDAISRAFQQLTERVEEKESSPPTEAEELIDMMYRLEEVKDV